MAYCSDSVYSGEVPWYMRSENNPRYRPFGAFAGCMPQSLPRQKTEEEKEYEANEERMERELDAIMLRYRRSRTPSPSPSPEPPAPEPRPEPKLAVFLRQTNHRIQETRAAWKEWYARTAFTVDGKLYWAGRWYRERSIFPELFYVLRCVVLVVVVLALVGWLVKLKVEEWRESKAEEELFVYTHVPQYRVWSVTKPRCECGAECADD